MRSRFRQWVCVLAVMAAATGCREVAAPRPGPAPVAGTGSSGRPVRPRGSWPVYTLSAEQTWQLNLPRGQRFDASALTQLPDGTLLTVSDRGPEVYRIEFLAGSDAADLIPLPGVFTPAQLAPFAGQKIGRYDCEGLAVDAAGRLYLCEEANRWILRWDPARDEVERLPIDWTPARRFFSRTDRNASFEGVAIGDGRLYVANERQSGRILAVDLATLKVVDDFVLRPAGSHHHDIQYSDLSWFEGVLYVLCRRDRAVLKVDPVNHVVLAQFNYRAMEDDPAVTYRTIFPVGFMEGLAVTREWFWLVTDNNGFGHSRNTRDRRPTLFRCRRPDA